MYNIIADLHTHTTLSLHAYSTVNENICGAVEHGMKYLASTDHYFRYGEDDSTLRFNESQGILSIRRISRTDNRIKFIAGVEYNTCQDDGIPKKTLVLPWRISSCHDIFTKDKTIDDIKNHLTYLIENKLITTVGHPDKFLHNKFNGDDYKEFYQWLIKICKENNIYIELNNASCKYEDCKKYILYWLSLAKENNVMISLGSDAHYFLEVGDFGPTIKILEEAEFPEELILNCDEEKLEELFKKQLEIQGV